MKILSLVFFAMAAIFILTSRKNITSLMSEPKYKVGECLGSLRSSQRNKEKWSTDPIKNKNPYGRYLDIIRIDETGKDHYLTSYCYVDSGGSCLEALTFPSSERAETNTPSYEISISLIDSDYYEPVTCPEGLK